jgi:hypothetical protein
VRQPPYPVPSLRPSKWYGCGFVGLLGAGIFLLAGNPVRGSATYEVSSAFERIVGLGLGFAASGEE